VAIAAFVVSLAGFVVVTVLIAPVLAVLALLRIRRTGAKGRGLAVWGLVVSLLWATLIAVIVAAVLGGRATRDSAGYITHGGVLPVYQLRVGDCLTALPEGSPAVVHVAPCAQSHQAQVVGQYTVAGTTFPGGTQIRAQAHTRCRSLAGPAALAARGKDLEIVHLLPNAESWQNGEHLVSCVLGSHSTPLSGSLV
jgi:hypothetical protein